MLDDLGGEYLTSQIYIRFIRLPIIVRILVIATSLVIVFGTMIHFIEPENFPTIFDGVWWAIITASTVGYGDFVPLSVPGRVTGIILLLVGTGFLSSYFITLSAATVKKQNEYLEGKVDFKGDNHVIIVGWNERSRTIIRTLSESSKSIILVDETLKSNPIKNDYVH